MKKYLRSIVFACVSVINFGYCNAYGDLISLAPPNPKAIDEFGVDLATGQVIASAPTVSIGGAMGLQHSISLQANDLHHIGNNAFTDSYSGNAKFVEVGTSVLLDSNVAVNSGNSQNPITLGVFRLFGPLGTHDFGIYVGNKLRPDAGIPNVSVVTSAYEYRSLSDDGHTLRETGSQKEYLIWTTPDGTELKYARSTEQVIKAITGGSLVEVLYPNGLKLSMRVDNFNVKSNAGFMIKRFYGSVGPNLSTEKQQIFSGLTIKPHTATTTEWAKNTGTIVGINLAYEYCGLDSTCNLAMDWPTASLHWEDGAPLSYFLGESVFSVIDASGGRTDFHYEVYDTCETYTGTIAVDCASQSTGATRWSPRLGGS